MRAASSRSPALPLGEPFPAQRPAVGGGLERPDLRGQPADGRALGGDLLLELGEVVVDHAIRDRRCCSSSAGVAGTPSSPTQPSGSVHDRRSAPVRS